VSRATRERVVPAGDRLLLDGLGVYELPIVPARELAVSRP
jgi:hypothetical protein